MKTKKYVALEDIEAHLKSQEFNLNEDRGLSSALRVQGRAAVDLPDMSQYRRRLPSEHPKTDENIIFKVKKEAPVYIGLYSSATDYAENDYRPFCATSGWRYPHISVEWWAYAYIPSEQEEAK